MRLISARQQPTAKADSIHTITHEEGKESKSTGAGKATVEGTEVNNGLALEEDLFRKSVIGSSFSASRRHIDRSSEKQQGDLW